ncbi:MAG: glycoside hydrolase family 28 protein [Candidatus Neomarinimicrobiota bacterium]
MKKFDSVTKNSRLIPFILIMFGLMIACRTTLISGSGWEQVPEILKKIVPPEFPKRDFNITDYGALGDGEYDCTGAFSRAINACNQAGGGRVVVPAGKFLTGAIHLKSNVNLHVMSGATVLFSKESQKYLPVVYSRFEGVECMNYSPFIYAYEQKNLAITGEGTLDGQADSTAWWPWVGDRIHGWQAGEPEHQYDRDQLMKMAEENIPVEKRIFGEGHFLRPNFIQFYKSENILIEGVTIIRSPMWEIHPVLCENVTVRKITVISHGPNNDGCDPESCRNVLIKECFFDTGDDCIAIKSGRNGDGRRINIPSENIIIQDCRMKDGHGGVVIGSEMSGNCRNVFAENCVMDSPNLERALRIKTNSLRGGVVENIYMRNVTVGKVSEAVVWIYFYYSEGDIGEHTPIVRNVYVSNVTSQESDYALLLNGYARSPVTNVNLENCRFDGVNKPSIIKHVKGLKMKDVYINGQLQ